ncbi:MAG: NAAT family transporter [Armatimonadetes bacterium]|nr:NAAT family transporter [Armatimonadota bacterium]
MSSAVQFGILAFSSLLAMLDPIAAAPVFLQLTSGRPERRREVAFKASIAAFVALGLFAVAGGVILSFFGITVPAFQIAGGLLFLLSAIKALHGHESHASQAAPSDPSIVPIGIPLIAGAGSISTVMVLSGQARNSWLQAALGGAILVNILIVFLVLRVSPMLARKLGDSGQEALSKVFGLLAAVLGVQFIINGLTAVAIGFLHHAR